LFRNWPDGFGKYPPLHPARAIGGSVGSTRRGRFTFAGDRFVLAVCRSELAGLVHYRNTGRGRAMDQSRLLVDNALKIVACGADKEDQPAV
jgi:hypothetical protein